MEYALTGRRCRTVAQCSLWYRARRAKAYAILANRVRRLAGGWSICLLVFECGLVGWLPGYIRSPVSSLSFRSMGEPPITYRRNPWRNGCAHGGSFEGVAPMRSTRLFVSTLGLELRIMSRLASCGRNVFNVPTGNGTPPSWSGPGLKPGYGCVARIEVLALSSI